MRHEIKVLTYGDAPFGNYSLERTYVEVAATRARVVNISGSASREGKGIDANITHTVLIRKPEFALTTENMLEWVHAGVNEYLRPRQVRPVGRTSNDPREQFVMILCESVGTVEAYGIRGPELSYFETTWMSPAVDNQQVHIPYSGTGFSGLAEWFIEGNTADPVQTGKFKDGDMGALAFTMGTKGTTYTCKVSGTFPKVEFTDPTNRQMIKTVESLGLMVWSATGLVNGFQGCSSMTKCVFGETDAHETCTTLESTFQGCTLLDTLPDLSPFTLITSIDSAFRQMPALATPPDLSNMALIVDAESAFKGGSSLTTIIPMNNINVLSNAQAFLNGCDSLTSDTIDLILNTWAASVLANGGQPSTISTDLGINEYTAAGEASYEYLIGLGWTIAGVSEVLTGWIPASHGGFDINTMTWSPRAQETTINTGQTEKGFGLSPDGINLIIGDTTGTIHSYTLATPFQFDTATLVASRDFVPALSNINFNISPSGTDIIIWGIATKTFTHYKLTTAWDVTTLVFQSDKIILQAQSSMSIHINVHGTKIIVIGWAASQATSLWTMSTAWDLTTLVFDHEHFIDPTAVYQQMMMSDDGTTMICGSQGTTTTQWPFAIPWDLTSVGSKTIHGGDNNYWNAGMWMAPDGAKLYTLRDNGQFKVYDTNQGY
jgi:hypothetical protein